MSKHYQPYQSPDANSPAANSEMPAYPGRLVAPVPLPPPPAPGGSASDKIKWIAVTAIAILLILAVASMFAIQYINRKLDTRESRLAAAPPAQREGAHSSLFEDPKSDGDSAKEPMRTFELDKSIPSSGAGADPLAAEPQTNKSAPADGLTMPSDVRFNAQTVPAPRPLGPAPGSRTTPTEVPVIKEKEADSKYPLNLRQPGRDIPMTRRMVTPPAAEPAPQLVPGVPGVPGVPSVPMVPGVPTAPAVSAAPTQPDTATYRTESGVLAVPPGYSAQPTQPAPTQPAPMQAAPRQPFAAQPAPQPSYPVQPPPGYPHQAPQQAAPQPTQPYAPAPMQPQVQPPVQPIAPTRPLPPAAQLDPYANVAGSPTNANQTPPLAVPPTSAPSINSDFGRGLSMQQAGDLDRAIEYYKRAIDANPQHFGAFNNLGVVYRQKGQYDQAIQVLSDALTLHPQDTRVANNLAGCYIKLGKFDQAERVLQQALAADPKDLTTLTNLGISNTSTNKFREAETYLNSAAQLHPSEPRTYFNLGNLYRRMGRGELAMRNYLRFLELSNGKFPTEEAQVRQMLGNTGSWR